jgi:hypothetical protein
MAMTPEHESNLVAWGKAHDASQDANEVIQSLREAFPTEANYNNAKNKELIKETLLKGMKVSDQKILKENNEYKGQKIQTLSVSVQKEVERVRKLAISVKARLENAYFTLREVLFPRSVCSSLPFVIHPALLNSFFIISLFQPTSASEFQKQEESKGERRSRSTSTSSRSRSTRSSSTRSTS